MLKGRPRLSKVKAKLQLQHVGAFRQVHMHDDFRAASSSRRLLPQDATAADKGTDSPHQSTTITFIFPLFFSCTILASLSHYSYSEFSISFQMDRRQLKLQCFRLLLCTRLKLQLLPLQQVRPDRLETPCLLRVLLTRTHIHPHVSAHGP